MLALDRPLGVVGELVLFGDHADPSRVWWAPTRPTLADAGGQPEIAFVKFRDADAAQGGVGLLSFTCELVASEAALEEARRHAQRVGVHEPVLSQFPWRSGKATLAAALREGDGFVEQLLGETPCDVLGGNRAVFSMKLTQEGAALVEALVRGDASSPSPLGVRYELEYDGLRPALAVRVEADYRRVYDELSWGFQAGVAYDGIGVRAGVESATKKLVESGAIRIEVLRFVDDAELRARVDAAVQWLQEQIVRDFFKSHMQPQGRPNLLEAATAAAAALGAGSLGEALADASLVGRLAEQLGLPVDMLRQLGGGGGGAAGGGAGTGGASSTFALNLQFSFKDIHEEELVTMRFDWNEAHAETRTAAPQGLLSAMGAAPRVVEASDAGSFWQRLDVDVRPLGDFAALGVQRLVAQLAYPDERTPTTQVALTFEPGDATAKHFSAWTDGNPPSYRVRSEVHFLEDGPWQGPPTFIGEWSSASSLQLAVHPLSGVPRLEVELVPGTLSFAETPQVQIDTRIDGEAARSFALTEAAPRAMLRARLGPPPPVPTVADPGGGMFDGPPPPAVAEPPPRLELRNTWFFADGPSVTGPWTNVAGTSWVVHGPWRSQRSLRLFPLLPADTLEALVTVTLEEDGRSRTTEVRFEAGDKRTKVVSMPALAEVPPPVRIDVVVIRGDGSTFVGAPVTTADPVFIVRDRDGEHRQVKVRLVAGPELASHGVIAVAVQLLEPEGDAVVDTLAFTQSQREPGVLLVPVVAGGPPMTRYRVVRYGLDGAPMPGEIQRSGAGELLVSAAAGG